ncbi:MAG: AMP-binding protein [Phenylobacterium sp.]|uniref:AMP-binding protein n=1 Tax=Phenylobacterium sp. TaxID=1871053 RepID=UPI002734841A|nr:AMP-binding protein [Phenylobacterium sp.]MDP3173306.1 AMP-binding protein [Phenylobacterium sp.]
MSDPELLVGPTLAEFERLAMQRWPDREALVGGGRRVSYREMSADANRFARFLKGLGLKRGDAVAVLSANRPELVAAIQGAQILGLRCTPLHPMGSEDDQAFILEDAEIDALIVDVENHSARGRALMGRVSLKHVVTLGAGDYGVDALSGMAPLDGADLPIEARPEDICVINYTGGTTGRPKGVVHRHRSRVHMLTNELAYWEWPQEVRFLIATPMSHAAGSMLDATLVKGGTFHFHASFDVEAFLETIQREKITATFLVPTMLYVLLDHPRLKDYDLSSLEMLIYGAAPMSPTRLKQALEVFGPIISQLYGQSEVPQTITYMSKSDHDLSRPERLESCGLPIPTNQVRLIRPDGQEAQQGEPGEICVRGPIVMEGYWKRPEETEKAFAGGWLHTGDVARRDADGYLYIVDRTKDMIISGGFNVFPREVEDVLADHPAVAMAAVVGAPDEKWGETVKAFVTLKAGASVSEAELIAFVRERKGVVYAPKMVEMVDALPLTALGKLDKKALRDRIWAGRERQVG